MRRDDDQVSAFLYSGFIDRRGAVSGNGRCADWNTIKMDALEKSLHLTATSAPSRFHVSGRVVSAAARGHHNRAEISDVQDHDARTYLFGESNRVP